MPQEKSLRKRFHNSFVGRYGEFRARHYLHRNKYVLLERNIRIGGNEIDIIAQHKRTLIFVEVKTRGPKSGDPLDAIGSKKERRLKRAAERYLFQHKVLHRYQKIDKVRFDCIAITLDGWRMSLLHYFDIFGV